MTIASAATSKSALTVEFLRRRIVAVVAGYGLALLMIQHAAAGSAVDAG